MAEPPSSIPLSGKGVVLRCSWCLREERLDLGDAYKDRASAELFLHLMTGGWSGSPGDMPFRRTSVADQPNPILEAEGQPQVGQSACCHRQLEGETYGYE